MKRAPLGSFKTRLITRVQRVKIEITRGRGICLLPALNLPPSRLERSAQFFSFLIECHQYVGRLSIC